MNLQDKNHLRYFKMEKLNHLLVNGSESPKPFAMRALGLVPKYWNMCSEGTKNNFNLILQNVIIMSVFLGSIMAFSLSNLFFGHCFHGFWLLPITIAFYLFIERMVVIGKNNAWQNAMRIFLAMIIVVITSVALDDLLFSKDIDALYEAELQTVKDKSQVKIDSLNNIRSTNVSKHQEQITGLNDSISKARTIAVNELNILYKNSDNGKGPNYIEKRKAFAEEEAQRNKQINELKNQFNAEDSLMNQRVSSEIVKLENAKNIVSDGFASRIGRLYNYLFSDSARTSVCIFIWLFFTLLEFIVLISKFKHPTAEYYLYQQIEADANVDTNREQSRISKTHVIDIATARSNVEKIEAIRSIENTAKSKEMIDNNVLEFKLATELSNGLNQLNSILKELLSAHPDLKKDLENTKSETNRRIFDKREELIK